MTPAHLRWAEVDLGAIRHNVAQLRGRLQGGTAMMAVVKADAYGHGAVAVSHAALEAGADWLAVSTLEEAITLRDGGVEAPVMLLGPVAAGSEPAVVAAGVRVGVQDAEEVARLAAASRGGPPVRVHLKVDTGMTRLGCPPEEALILARRVAEASGLELEGLWTHFAEADDRGTTRTARQLQAFLAVVADLATAGVAPPVVHAANSAAALLSPSTQFTMVRCGLPMYGYESATGEGLELRRALTWKARVVALHRLRPGDRVGYGGTFVADSLCHIATVATGYADGYRRALSGVGEVLHGGARLPVVGRISMDFLTIDATASASISLGDEVVLMGADDGLEVSADDIAARLGTISWEVLATIGRRVQRVYLDG